MLSETGIQSVNVEGLHEQFDVNIDFKPGLNIIYGKNGRGKTTVLHLLANALELDFERFSHLNFKSITIRTFGGAQMDIIRPSKTDSPRVFLNGAATGAANEPIALTDVEAAAIRAAFGERPTYLPAFRSVLERSRTEASPYYRESAKEGELEAIEAREHQALRELLISRRGEFGDSKPMREEASTTARKTLQCRQWFGPFVPTIRYPSILEVSSGLTAEWRRAQMETAQREQTMFADVFVKVFRTIVGIDQATRNLRTEDLLVAIASSLNSDDYKLGTWGSESIYKQLSEATDYLKEREGPDANGVENSVLHLYLETLRTRKEERKNAFQKSRDFEMSINKFLDKKKLKVGGNENVANNRTPITVGTDEGGSYGLSALSSGEKQILTMLYSASRSRFRNGVFLIDEPELSLHIDWQRQILRELMAQAPDRQIIVCTHSPEVGADHIRETQDFEPSASIAEQHGLPFSDVESDE